MRQYILSVVSAAIICAVIKQLACKSGPVQSVLRIVAGVFVMFTVLQPLVHISFSGITDIVTDFSNEAQISVDTGLEYATEGLSAIIKDRTEAYILDKAKQFGAQLEIEVLLSKEHIPIPVEVRIRGAISPYGKKCMTELISSDLGISEEAQSWM